MKKWKVVMLIVCAFLVVTPIVLIVFISSIERSQYVIKSDYIIEEKSFGEPEIITRGDISEVINLKGTFTANKIINLPCPPMNNVIPIYPFSENDEIRKGDIIFQRGNDIIVSPVNGILKSINYEKNTISILSLEELYFETYVDLAFDFKELYEVNSDDKLDLIFLSNISENEKRKALFKSTKNQYLHGQEKTFSLKTGNKEEGVLLAPKICIYKKEDENYIRIIDEQGNFIKEEKIKVGISDQTFASISKGNEGAYCDTGYRNYLESIFDTNANDDVDKNK